MGDHKITYEEAVKAKEILIQYLNDLQLDYKDLNEYREETILFYALTQEYFRKL